MGDEPSTAPSRLTCRPRSNRGSLTAGERLRSDADLGAEYRHPATRSGRLSSLADPRGRREAASGATLVRKKIDPFRTVVSAATGFGGFEGAAYASDVAASNRSPAVTRPRVEIEAAPEDIATALGLDEGAAVVVRHQERFIDDELWSMQTSYYPMTLVERGATKLSRSKTSRRNSPVSCRGDRCSRDRLSRHHDGSCPTPGEAARFGLPEDGRIAVFAVRQMGVDPEKNPYG